MTGANLVVTVPPFYVEEIVTFPSPERIRFLPDRIEVDPPIELLDRLMQIPYFERGYEENGYTRAEYNSLPGLQFDSSGVLGGDQSDGRVRKELSAGSQRDLTSAARRRPGTDRAFE